jgi:N-acetylmuramoyl-L-alanine amidase
MRLKLTIPLLIAGLLTILFVTPACAGIRTVTSRGKSYAPLSNIAAYYGMTLSGPSGKRIRLQNKWNKIEFQTDSRNAWINGTLVVLNEPVRKAGWQWAIGATDFNKTIEPAVRPKEFLKGVGMRTIVLDPGHGGNDKGASSPRNVQEKLVVLDVAKRVEKILESRGVRVELTRTRDHYLSLDARCRKAAALKADIFVSIHANATANRSVRGTETFVLSLPGLYSSNAYGSGNPPSSAYKGNHYDIANMALGFSIHRSLIKTSGQEDRGVKRARFQVLRDAPCPAVLVETAFLSNAKDETMVIDPAGRDRLARGIADGIFTYLANVKRAKK